MKKVYLSGPMRGRPDLNEIAFIAASSHARERGWDPVDPHRLRQPKPDDIRAVMRVDIDALLLCDAILMLEGWGSSKGALAEMHLARAVGIPIYDIDSDRAPDRLPDLTKEKAK